MGGYTDEGEDDVGGGSGEPTGEIYGDGAPRGAFGCDYFAKPEEPQHIENEVQDVGMDEHICQRSPWDCCERGER